MPSLREVLRELWNLFVWRSYDRPLRDYKSIAHQKLEKTQRYVANRREEDVMDFLGEIEKDAPSSDAKPNPNTSRADQT